MARGSRQAPASYPLYTDEQRRRRDASAWTMVQGILAPVQFLVCIVSAVLVVYFLMTGDGYTAATLSILVKTGLLYLIMVTGAIWEKEVFGQYLFAPAFFWEDVVSFGVIALHTAYLWGLFTGAMSPRALMVLALVAYAAYVINAAQFLWKLRMARLGASSGPAQPAPPREVSA
ncbi:MAG: 2-vinyl bacteriochlorophyllide hydratase [Pararhodobacter sp.]